MSLSSAVQTARFASAPVPNPDATASEKTILDLGCGKGTPLPGVSGKIIGLDISASRVEAACSNYPERKFIRGSGHAVPLQSQSVDQIVSNVGLPYMDIQRTLNECFRVLRPGGGFRATLHPFTFTLHEFARNAFPRPKAMLYRLFVMWNGIQLFFTGCAQRESFQTERGLRKAMKRAGFSDVQFGHTPRGSWMVSAIKPAARDLQAQDPEQPEGIQPRHKSGIAA